MALWWCANIFCRLAAVWFPLLFSSLLWQTIPTHAIQSCPRSCSCPGVKEVHCTFRHLTIIPKAFPKDTERLNLGYNSLTEVEGSEFRSLRQLEMLMLHGNDISTLHPGAFYSLRSLQILKLSYNKLTSVSAGLFEGLVGLIRLHLDHNLIDFIEPYSFSGLTSLKLLQLEGNLLKEIHPHTFITVSLLGSFWTSGLKHLHLSDNLLEQLPAAALKTASRLEVLSLHGNPWTCDCQLNWLVEWSSTHEGIVKCKKERGISETCPQCSSPQSLNGTLLLGLTPDKLTCERPMLRSPLKQWDNPVWAESEAEPDLPYTRDFEKPLGHLTFVLSDSHGNSAHVACDVRHPGDSSPMTWTVNPLSPGELSVNVSLVTVLECEIDRETLQNLWQLVAYYYESAAILERGQQKGNASRITYQYAQAINENSPYFTDLKGYLVAEPSWLLQPRVTLRLNRQQTTTKKLVMDFTTVITKHINSHRGQDDDNDLTTSWALIRRGTAGRVQTALDGSKVHLVCSVVTSNPEVKVEWMLPDLSIVEDATDKIKITEKGELVILNATLSDSGLYHCMVRTKAGVDLMPLRLTIKERTLGPTAFNGQKIVVEKDRSFSLQCEVTSVQPSQTMWYLPKNQILLPTQQTKRAQVMENGTLVVTRLTQEDAGEYSCLTSNLYGVDMLSHIVEVTDDNASGRSKVQTERDQLISPVGREEGEGSGGDYQEIIRPFATQFPKKLEKQQRNPNRFSKRIRIQDSKRKHNKSVKELDPDRWAEILAKAKAKPSVALPTEQSLPEPNTVTVQTSTSKLTTTIASIIAHSPNNLPPTTSPPDIKTKGYSTDKNLDNGKAETSGSLPQILRPPPPISTDPTPQHVGGIVEEIKAVTDPPAVGTPQPVDQPENKPSGEGKRNFSLVPGQSNRRRLPYRHRKPPMRRIRPHVHPLDNSPKQRQTTVSSTTTTTTPTTTVTSTTTTTTTIATTTTPVPTTVESRETISAGYQIEDGEGEYSEEYDYKDSDSLDAKEELNSEISYATNDHSSSLATFSSAEEKDTHEGRHNLPNQKTTASPKLDSNLHPTERTVEVIVNINNSDGQGVKIREPTEEKGRENQNFAGESEREAVTAMKGQEKHKIDTEGSEKSKEKSKKEWVTQSNNMQDNIQLMTQNRPRPNTQPSVQQNTPSQARTSAKVLSSNSTRGRTRQEVTQKEDKGLNKPKVPSKIDSFPIMEPVHPWLHQNNRGGGQTTSSRMSHTNQDRNTGRQDEVNPNRHSQAPRVPPTSRWPSHHHHHHYFPLSPSWPHHRSFPHPRHGPGSHPLPTHRPWPFPHPWSQNQVVTNRPEITAETVKPTPTISGTTGNTRFTLSKPHMSHDHQTHHVDGRTQTRDQLFLSRLRNRYRQAQLDRIAQRGRIVTPKPHTSYHNPNPIPHRPHTPKPLAPTASYTYTLQPLKPVKPSSSSFSGFIPTPRPYHPTTPGVLYGSRWPVGAGRISSRRPTAAPPFPWVFGAESGGVKPRITTETTASVSVLAESDVFLHCKATGNPEPSIAWTKVSTGATIPANSKHGPRFEVFKNGTFVIKNIQLQDRGQYLCTAQNRFGSDRMVITLAVQTEAPKIQPPKYTEIAVYLGKGVTLDCFASGKPPAQISWILPDRSFVREVGTAHTHLSAVSLLQNGTLQIHSPNFSSKGDYKCIASNAAGADTITYHLHVAALPPSISEGMDTVIIQPGRSVYVHCSVKGEPEPSLKWTLPTGVHVKPSQFLGRRLFVFPNGTLYVKNVSPVDAGSYECLATNAVGIAKRTVLLEVRVDSPSFPRQPPAPLPIPQTHRHGVPSRQHSVSAMYGSAVYLHCPESTGSTRGTFWQLPSKTLMEHQYSPERPIKVFRNGTLRILQLTELDGGNYLCVFQRPNGEDMELFQVEVLMTPPRIEHVRTPQTRVTFGENFQVDCVATGLPDPEVSWSLPDGTVINNALQSDDSGLRNRRFVIFGNGTLLLQQMGKKDEGDYTCYAKNKLGKDERKVSVKVGPNAPKIRFKSQSLVTVKLGEAAKLSCQATGEPLPKIIWISPRNDVIPMSSDKFQIMGDGVLLVKKVRLADEGKYVCVARNSAGDDVKNMKLEAEPQEPFINDMKGKSTTKLLAVSYQTVLLDCRVEGKPEPRVWWVTSYGHSLPTPYLGGRFQVHRNGSLELRGVRKTDEGRYMCLAKNNLGEASHLVEVEVASLAEKPSFAVPNIEILPIKQDGGALSLECPARGKPNPEFAWILPNGTMLTPGVRLQRFAHHLGNGTLQISQPVASDKGVYRCLAKNVAGQAEKRYSLETGRKPLIRGSTGGMKITYGLNLNLPCSVDGWPQPSITWTLPNGLVLDKPQTISRVSFLANGTLQLRHVATFDKGTYTCKASNSFGSSTLSYPVTVMVFRPRITSTLSSITRVSRGSPVTLNCVATGIPKPDISWTLPGRTTLVPHNRFTVQGGIHMTEDGSLFIQNPVLMNSGIYKCNAKNALGTDFKSTYLQVV
ncbi:matrix-remodeling-associated protein 5 [Chaetodon trifascialis]|uniref:matrix-remodeling-associated protein 5 n=1 Tax=Chaetodon trifascialis TaxID=109706 RepID=UPI00399543D5